MSEAINLFGDAKNRKKYSYKLRGVSIFTISLADGTGWVRLFGKGVHWKDTTKHPLYFSDRNGYRKTLTIGKWRIKLLN